MSPPWSVCRLETHSDGRGRLVAVEAGEPHLPFEIRRVYYIYGVPAGQVRGLHAHRKLQQLMVAVSGGLDVILDDGRRRRRIRLDDPTTALLVPPMTWREMRDFAPGTVCLVLASAPYDESDYIRTYESFRAEAAVLATGAVS